MAPADPTPPQPVPQGAPPEPILPDNAPITPAILSRWVPWIVALCGAIGGGVASYVTLDGRVAACERDLKGIQTDGSRPMQALAGRVRDLEGSVSSRLESVDSQLAAARAARDEDRAAQRSLTDRFDRLDRRFTIFMCRQDRALCRDD